MNSVKEDGDSYRDPAPNTADSRYDDGFNENIFPRMDDRPTMPELYSLERSGGRSPVKIIGGIGRKESSELGTELLNDLNGTTMDKIKADHRFTEDINSEIFNYWMKESTGVSWKALVNALRTVGLNRLADDIVDALSN